MKRIMSFLIMLLLVAAPGFASMSPDEARKAHREEMKKIKSEMKSKRQEEKVPQGKAHGFWAKEAERSGLDQWSPSKLGNAFGNLNPVRFLKDQEDKYKTRKGGVK